MRRKDKAFFLWLFFLIAGVCCTAVLLFGRLQAERRDERVAAAVYYGDVVRLARLGGQTADDWLAVFSQNGVRYVIFEAEPEAGLRERLAGFDLSPAGYPGDGSAFVLPEYDWSSQTDVPLVLIENATRTSVEYPEGFDMENHGGPLVKALRLSDYYASRFSVDGSGQEVENLLFRAAVDRGMRLLLLRPFTDVGGDAVTDPSVYAKVLSGLAERLAARGLRFGEDFSCMDTSALRPALLWGSGCLTAALWVFLITRLKGARRWGLLLGLLALAGMALGCVFLPKLTQKVLMLLCAAVFPCVAVYGLWRWRDTLSDRFSGWQSYLLALGAVLLWSVLGGFAVGALMGDRSYLMGELIFSGVKAAQGIPLLLCAVLFGIPVVKDFFAGSITKRKVLPLLGAAVLLLAAGAVLVLRSGDVAGISALETEFRDTLEYSLYVRPRTKELLIAVPFMAAGFSALGRRSPLVMLIAGLCFALESVSVVNTFCHAVAPLHVSLIRSVLGAGIGCVFGLVILVLCRVIFRLSEKIAADRRPDR